MKIDPTTAETWWGWGQELDPYNLGDLPDECYSINRLYFARAPGTNWWVEEDYEAALDAHIEARLTDTTPRQPTNYERAKAKAVAG